MQRAIEARQASNRAVGYVDTEGGALVGFGAYAKMTRKALFYSVAEEHKAFVKEIVSYPVSYPGGKLDKLQKYILKMREEGVTADDEALAQFAEKMEQRITGKTPLFIINVVINLQY